VYISKEVIVEKKVQPRVSVVTKVTNPVEKVTLDTLPETGAEDYLMPLFYLAVVMSLVYAVKNKSILG
jgi:hypothetical protein